MLLLPGVASAQAPAELVSDVNSYPATLMVALGTSAGKDYFLAQDPQWGVQLWRSDGTPAGTFRLEGGGPQFTSLANAQTRFVDMGNFALYFNPTGTELWRTDGTQAGTSLVSPANGYAGLARAGGKAVFMNYGNFTGYEPWVTDGTPAGTKVLFDVVSGWSSSYPTAFLSAGDKVFFGAYAGGSQELWVTDGTPEGTHRTRDLAPGSTTQSAQPFARAGNRVIVSVYAGGSQLWGSDGTEAGTELLADLPNSDSANYAGREPTYVFDRVNPATSQKDVWITDGTAAGTKMVLSGAHRSYELRPAVLGGLTIFSAALNDVGGNALWATDGATTVQVNDDLCSPTSPTTRSSMPSWSRAARRRGALSIPRATWTRSSSRSMGRRE